MQVTRRDATLRLQGEADKRRVEQGRRAHSDLEAAMFEEVARAGLKRPQDGACPSVATPPLPPSAHRPAWPS